MKAEVNFTPCRLGHNTKVIQSRGLNSLECANILLLLYVFLYDIYDIFVSRCRQLSAAVLHPVQEKCSEAQAP